MEQSKLVLGHEPQSEELFSQQNQRGNPDLIEKLEQDDQIMNNSTKNQTNTENNIGKKEKERKFYEIVFKFYGINEKKIKHDYGKSKNYISKKEIVTMVEKRQKQLEEQKKQMEQEEEIRKVEELKKIEQTKKNIIKGEIPYNNKNYKTLIIPSLFVGAITNGNLVSQIYLNLFELNQFQLNFNINNNYNNWNNNFNA